MEFLIMNLDNKSSPYPSNVENYTANKSVNDLLVSNLAVSADKNQFTNLFLPCKYVVCSHLNPQDFGIWLQ